MRCTARSPNSNEEEEPINTKYAIWSGPGATATILDFEQLLEGFPARQRRQHARLPRRQALSASPGGSETEVAGLRATLCGQRLSPGDRLDPRQRRRTRGLLAGGRSHRPEHAAAQRIRLGADPRDRDQRPGRHRRNGHPLGKQRIFIFKPEINLEASISGSPTVALPEEGTTTESFTVTLSKESAKPVTVGYETEDGTATVENDDYTEASGTLTFAPGETTKTIEVQIDDGDGNDEEAVENYKVRLQGTATVAPASSASTATGAIGLPGISGKLTTGPASGAAKPLSPAAGISIEVVGNTTAGQAVKQTVTSDAAGAYTASVDPGTYSLTATGLPTGQPTGFKWSPSAKCPGKRKEATCEAVPVKMANGTVVQSTVDFGYGQRDPQIENVEVLQATQLKNWDKQGPEVGIPGVGTVASYGYTGVGLAAKSQTVVRVYAQQQRAGVGPGGERAIQGI